MSSTQYASPGAPYTTPKYATTKLSAKYLPFLRVLSTFYTLVAGRPQVVYTRYSALGWLFKS